MVSWAATFVLIPGFPLANEINSVVFSSWTTTLDMISSTLDKSGIKYVRIDGNVSIKNRVRALQNYQRDRCIRVILLSISCGAEG